MHRFLLDNDGSNFFCHTMGDSVEASIAEAVADCPSEVSTYLLCATGAGKFYDPTQVGEVVVEDYAKVGREGRLQELHTRGQDPFGLFLQALRRAGKETFITYRMNDVHHADQPDHPAIPAFRKAHPEMIVDHPAVLAGKADWMAYCMDYTHTAVREYILATLAELIDRYEVEGLQLDWLRFPRHLSGKPEEVWEKREILTEFTARVRELIKRSGKPMLLAARVPTSPDGCQRVGLDIGAWTARGLVDFLVATPFLTTDFSMPIRQLRASLGLHPVPLYADIEFGHSNQVHCPESLRAAALGLLAGGADGIYLFNFPCWTEYLGSRPYHWIGDLSEDARAVQKPLLFSVPHRLWRLPHIDLPAQLPASLPAGGSLSLSLSLPAAALPARRALVLVHGGGDLGCSLNGQPLAELPYLRRTELFVEYRDEALKAHWPAAADCRLFQAEPSLLRPGENHLLLNNSAGAELELRRVNLGLW